MLYIKRCTYPYKVLVIQNKVFLLSGNRVAQLNIMIMKPYNSTQILHYKYMQFPIFYIPSLTSVEAYDIKM